MSEHAPLYLFHVTTQKRAAAYAISGCIVAPVRGFDSLIAAMAWAIKVGRDVIYAVEVDPSCTHLLPDHHNKWGRAWWTESAIPRDKMTCVYSTKDA